ncbi:MAG: hypothetical protein ACTHMJ_20195 [Thermomicrobiales bacterium]
MQTSIPMLHRLLEGLDHAERAGVWAEIEAGLRQFEGPDGYAGPGEFLLGAGTK